MTASLRAKHRSEDRPETGAAPRRRWAFWRTWPRALRLSLVALLLATASILAPVVIAPQLTGSTANANIICDNDKSLPDPDQPGNLLFNTLQQVDSGDGSPAPGQVTTEWVNTDTGKPAGAVTNETVSARTGQDGEVVNEAPIAYINGDVGANAYAGAGLGWFMYDVNCLDLPKHMLSMVAGFVFFLGVVLPATGAGWLLKNLLSFSFSNSLGGSIQQINVALYHHLFLNWGGIIVMLGVSYAIITALKRRGQKAVGQLLWIGVMVATAMWMSTPTGGPWLMKNIDKAAGQVSIAMVNTIGSGCGDANNDGTQPGTPAHWGGVDISAVSTTDATVNCVTDALAYGPWASGALGNLAFSSVNKYVQDGVLTLKLDSKSGGWFNSGASDGYSISIPVKAIPHAQDSDLTFADVLRWTQTFDRAEVYALSQYKGLAGCTGLDGDGNMSKPGKEAIWQLCQTKKAVRLALLDRISVDYPNSYQQAVGHTPSSQLMNAMVMFPIILMICLFIGVAGISTLIYSVELMLLFAVVQIYLLAALHPSRGTDIARRWVEMAIGTAFRRVLWGVWLGLLLMAQRVLLWGGSGNLKYNPFTAQSQMMTKLLLFLVLLCALLMLRKKLFETLLSAAHLESADTLGGGMMKKVAPMLGMAAVGGVGAMAAAGTGAGAAGMATAGLKGGARGMLARNKWGTAWRTGQASGRRTAGDFAEKFENEARQEQRAVDRAETNAGQAQTSYDEQWGEIENARENDARLRYATAAEKAAFDHAQLDVAEAQENVATMHDELNRALQEDSEKEGAVRDAVDRWVREIRANLDDEVSRQFVNLATGEITDPVAAAAHGFGHDHPLYEQVMAAKTDREATAAEVDTVRQQTTVAERELAQAVERRDEAGLTYREALTNLSGEQVEGMSPQSRALIERLQAARIGELEWSGVADQHRVAETVARERAEVLRARSKPRSQVEEFENALWDEGF